MEKLESNEIQPNEAIAMTKLVAQAENLLTYELKRSALLSNPDFKANFRNIEIKAFDSIPDNISSIDQIDKLQTEINKLQLELKEMKQLT